jgi:hypothetical protein
MAQNAEGNPPETDTASHECAICRHDYDFLMPPALVEAAEQERLVVFAGAGISTESLAFPTSFYDDIKAQLPEPSTDESFPGVMSSFQAEHGRLKLIEQAIIRLRQAETFPAIRSDATRFHRELATIGSVREVITTNWDAFFEDECGALPIVVDGDYAFYNLPGRKVYKIHGSIRNVSTIVATVEDYKRAEERLRTSAIGGTLRHLLATKVIVFVGYSLRDADFRNVYGPLIEGMGELRPVAYFVSPYESSEADELGLRHVKTDGSHFLRSLKTHLVEKDVLLPDSAIGKTLAMRDIVAECHIKTVEMNWRENPEIVFSLAYQDGLLDALDRLGANAHTGEYSDRHSLGHKASNYYHLLGVAVERGRLWDAAYVEGYFNGLVVLLSDAEDADFVPLYELFDAELYGTLLADADDEGEVIPASDSISDSADSEGENREESEDWPRILTESQLLSLLGGIASEMPAVIEEGRGIVAEVGNLVPQHTPFLNGLGEQKVS